MDRNLMRASLVGLLCLVSPALAQAQQIEVEAQTQSVDFGFKAESFDAPMVPSISQATQLSLQSAASPTKPSGEAQVEPVASGSASAASPLTYVEDAAARETFPSTIDFAIIGMVLLTGVFMQRLLVRQRTPRRSQAVYIETVE